MQVKHVTALAAAHLPSCCGSSSASAMLTPGFTQALRLEMTPPPATLTASLG